MSAKPYTSCKYFKSSGNAFGGCKHPKAKTACIEYDIDRCHMSERKYKLKKIKQKESK